MCQLTLLITANSHLVQMLRYSHIFGITFFVDEGEQIPIMTPFKAFLAALVWCALCFEPTLAQIKREDAKDSLCEWLYHALQPVMTYLLFPNVNKLRFYADVNKLKHFEDPNRGFARDVWCVERIRKNFGIENFPDNVPMLWKLAWAIGKIWR